MTLFGRDRSSVCASCGRPAAEVNRIIKGPGLGICDACARSASEAIAGRPGPDPIVMTGATPTRRRLKKCSFCGRAPLEGRRLVVLADGTICSSCLTLSAELFARPT